MTNYLKDILSYIKIFIATIIAVYVVVGCVVWHIAYIEYNVVKGNIERVVVQVDEEKIKYLLNQEKIYPDDFTINLKLAILYEKKEAMNLADLQYKKALMKSPRSEYSLYRYALFCIKTERYTEAINLIENITDSPSKGVIGKKLAIYEKIAEELLEVGDYVDSSKIYALAYRYAKILSGNKKEEILNKLEKSYLLSADDHISRNNYEQAKLDLEALLKLKDSPLAEYKLALIYKPFDAEKSAEYLMSAFKKDPSIVNLEIYYNILEELIEKSLAEEDEVAAKLYKHKQARLKKFIENNLMYSSDLLVYNPRIKSENKLMGDKWLVFEIVTNSPLKIGSIMVKLVVEHPNKAKEGDEIRVDFAPTVNKQIKTIEYRLKQAGPSILSKGESIKCSLYARKKIRYDWTLIKEFDVKY